MQRQHAFKLMFMMLAAAALLVPGCSRGEEGYKKQYEQSNYDYGSNMPGDDKPVEGARAYGKMMEGGRNHTNQEFHYSKEASYLIGDMAGIRQAYVFITDRNAYVAIMLDDTATGTHRGPDEQDDRQDSAGYPEEENEIYANPRDLAIGDDNPYVVADHENLSHELKQTIAVKLRRMDPHLYEVYISANQHFINTFARLSKNGGEAKEGEAKLQLFNDLVAEEFK